MNSKDIIKYLSKCKTFDDIYQVTVNLDNKTKGDLFEIITFYLFKLCPVLNNNLEEIWLWNNIPNNILKNLNLPTKDKGIDLLAEIKGNYYAIQCKFRQDINNTITWKELSTFPGLSFGLNNKIKGGFFVTNTFDLCKEIEKSEKIESIYGDFFDNLPNNFFENICNDLSKKELVKYNKLVPLPYQNKCINKCKEYFTKNSRGYIEMACGTGKSITSYWIDKIFACTKTVIFVPSLYLLSQFYIEWVNQSYAEQSKITYFLIGSDADIDNQDQKYKSNGLLLFTDPEVIREYINKTKGKLVIICTYQSSDKLAQACNKNIIFDLGIFDEAHKTVGRVNKQFSMMLTDNRITIKERLFMTATPKIYNGTLDNDNNEEILSMDNEKYYGKQIFQYNTGNAIDDDRLVEYQLITILTTNKEIQENIKKNKLVQYKDNFTEEESNYLGTILILLKELQNSTCNHLITYHNTVNRAKKFRDFLIIINDILYKNKKIYIDSLDGSTSMTKRKKIIKEYIQSEKGILSSSRVLNEGVNIPIIDSICFVDTRYSTIDIVQCIGRSLRKFDKKRLAHIFIPTFIENIDDDNNNNAYGNVIRILKSMKSTDYGITEYFIFKDVGKQVNSRKLFLATRFSEIKKSIEINLDEWQNTIMGKIWKINKKNEISEEELITIALMHKGKEQYNEMTEYLQKGMLLNYNRAFYEMAIYYHDIMKNNEKSIEYCKKSIELNNKDALVIICRYYYEQQIELFNDDDYFDKIKNYFNYLTNQQKVDIYVCISTYFYKINNVDKMIKYYNKAAELMKDSILTEPNKQKNNGKDGFICCLYGGCMKTGYVRYFTAENISEDEFKKYIVHYGDFKGKYTRITKVKEVHEKVCANLIKFNINNIAEEIYEIGIMPITKIIKETIKEVPEAKKLCKWTTYDYYESSKDEKNKIQENQEQFEGKVNKDITTESEIIGTGLMYKKKGHYKRMMNYLNKGMSLNYARAFYEAGKYYQDNKRKNEEMLKCYKKAAELNNKDACYELCKYYLDKKEYIKINDHINNVADKKQLKIYNSLVRVIQNVKGNLNDNKRAMEYYEKLILNNYSLHNNYKDYTELLHAILHNETASNPDTIKKLFYYAYKSIQLYDHKTIKKLLLCDYEYIYKNKLEPKKKCYICNINRIGVKLSCKHVICLNCYIDKLDYTTKKIKCKCKKLNNCKFNE